MATCNNNCKGVDPSSIIGAGIAAVVATGLAGQAAVPAAATGAVALGGGGAVAAGGMAIMDMMTRTQCLSNECQVSREYSCHDEIMSIISGEQRRLLPSILRCPWR